MEVLRFSLSGKTAFFKKPEVNTYYYFTYGNIHKVALLGIFGAVLGYGGYTQMKGFEKKKKQSGLTKSFPEFYEKLQDLQISILPKKKKGYIPKKVQLFNNSVGYASKEQGGNLIVKEQWLENPEWEICLLINSEEAQKVKEAICKRKCVYYPYLGKNDHPASICNIVVEEAQICKFEVGRIDCLAPDEFVSIADLDFDDKEDLDLFGSFQYKEALPYTLDALTNLYHLKNFLYTDEAVNVGETEVYQLSDGKKIVFY